ncbi:MAG: M48 family metalloprotease [Thermosynechococcaceae cyanobacterium]
MTSSHPSFRHLPQSLLLALVAAGAIATPTFAAPQSSPQTEPNTLDFTPNAQPEATLTLEQRHPILPASDATQAISLRPTSDTAPAHLEDQIAEAQLAEAPEVSTPAMMLEEQQIQSSEPLPTISADTSPESSPTADENKEATEEASDEGEVAPSLTPEELAHQQMLMEADALLTAGEVEAATALYRQAKDPFAEAPRPRAEAFSDPEKLAPGGTVYWRESAAGLDKDLQTRALVPAKLMVENYPEFVPGHLRYAEALKKYDQLGKGLAVLERAAARYPNQPDLQQGLIDFQVETKQWLEASITARQFALLNPNHPKAASFTALAEEYQAQYQRVLRQEITTNAVAGGLTAALNVALTANPFNAISSIQSSMLLLRGENSVGLSASKRAKKRYDIIEDPEVQAYVDRIGQKLVAVTGRDLEYEFNIIKDKNLNAFALPGGKIFLNAGAITKSRSEAELAGLMAHELAHTVLSHGFQLVTDGDATTGLTSLLPFGSLFSSLALNDYSRDMEEQADLLGTRMLSSAGYAADGLRNLMVTLGKEKEPQSPAWLSTHPRNKDRVSYLEELIETNGYNRYTYEGVATHLKIQERVQAILDAPTEDEKTPDHERKAVKDQEDTVPVKEPTIADSVEASKPKTKP